MHVQYRLPLKNLVIGYEDDAKLMGVSNPRMDNDLHLIEIWFPQIPINTLK